MIHPQISSIHPKISKWGINPKLTVTPPRKFTPEFHNMLPPAVNKREADRSPPPHAIVSGPLGFPVTLLWRRARYPSFLRGLLDWGGVHVYTSLLWPDAFRDWELPDRWLCTDVPHSEP
ncbi:hypothetical protein KIL84_009812 [Mauremys mutica]|uniref:Uncharacterized protein n=1 Tax=Mauremys mutica TaxID=74926 RepID=A0A9D3XLF1_9SAUR|nr:hypothetical protein KIL84_009812 [Mauremys mutica]